MLEGLVLSAWRDLNPRPLLPQSSALPGCATRRKEFLLRISKLRLISIYSKFFREKLIRLFLIKTVRMFATHEKHNSRVHYFDISFIQYKKKLFRYALKFRERVLSIYFSIYYSSNLP